MSKNAEIFERFLKKLEEEKIKTVLQPEDIFGPNVYRIELPNGKQTRPLFLSEDSALKYENIPLDKVVFLGDFDAILRTDTGVVEACVSFLDRRSSFFLSRLIDPRPRLPGIESDLDDEETEFAETQEFSAVSAMSAHDEESGIKIEFGTCSAYTTTLLRNHRRTHAVKISGVTFTRHDEVLQLLTKLTDSYFFSLSLDSGIALSLRKSRRRSVRYPRTGRRAPRELRANFPRHEYDKDPLSLYWYAMSASGMPLLEFLALYQVLEYYFPTFSKREAGRQIQSIIKDPTFRSDRETDVGRLLAVVSSSARGSIGNERQQLKATLKECVIEDELFEYLTEVDERSEFFSRVQKELTKHKILLGKPLNADIGAWADAIYDIRCKIVHSKMEQDDSEAGRLLPFSYESELLEPYIDLMKWIAQKVLITSSSPISLGRF